jgi:hypothetical protein
MKVLVACEESQAVTIEFRKLGHEAYSCDIQDCSGGHSEWHIKGDVLTHLEDGWDLIIAFPPCTHLACSGAKHFEQKKADGRQQRAIDFFMSFTKTKCKQVVIENPVGIMSTIYRKPDQIIQPHFFGDPFQKTTCLWLHNLPPLFHCAEDDLFYKKTHVSKGEFIITPSGKKLPKWYSDNKDPKIRSKTFPGIARAMAEQWG